MTEGIIQCCISIGSYCFHQNLNFFLNLQVQTPQTCYGALEAHWDNGPLQCLVEQRATGGGGGKAEILNPVDVEVRCILARDCNFKKVVCVVMLEILEDSFYLSSVKVSNFFLNCKLLATSVIVSGLFCRHLAVKPEVESSIPHFASLTETGFSDPQDLFELCSSKMMVIIIMVVITI